MKNLTPEIITKHIPFLQISNPPNIYDLKRAKEESIKKHGKKGNETFIRWDVEKEERKKLLNSYSSFETIYVSAGNLKKKAEDKDKNDYENDIIWTTKPGITELGTDKEKIKIFAGAPQFSFGGGVYTDKLFLMDDIFEWAHHRISWSEIRTAKSIVESFRKKK